MSFERQCFQKFWEKVENLQLFGRVICHKSFNNNGKLFSGLFTCGPQVMLPAFVGNFVRASFTVHAIIMDSNLELLYEIFYKIAFLEIISKYACFISVILGNFLELIWWTYFWEYWKNQGETPIWLSTYIWQILLRFLKNRLIYSEGNIVFSFWIKFMVFFLVQTTSSVTPPLNL